MNRSSAHRTNINEAGHAHELTFSCYRGFQFFQSERTCNWLIESIRSARIQTKFKLWAFVVMPEHVHLILYPMSMEFDISKIRRAIKGPTGKKTIAYLKENSPDWLAKIKRKRGDNQEYLFWQSCRGYDRNIVEPNTLMHMIDYIHMNPVRRGLVKTAIEWKCSSASWYLSHKVGPIEIDPIPSNWIGSSFGNLTFWGLEDSSPATRRERIRKYLNQSLNGNGAV